MMRENDSTLVRVEPEGEVKACVIWLHGLGADGYDFQPIVPYLKLPQLSSVRFLFPHAPVMPVTVNGGMEMRAWYDILEMNIDRKVDKTSLLSSSKRIAALIDSQIAEGIPADKIILAGFSQGGAVAYQTALCYPERLAGLVALSTYMATEDEIEQHKHLDNADLPAWVAHGSFDDVVPMLLGEQAIEKLQAMNYSPVWSTYPMGHEVSLEEMEALGEWIGQRLGELD
ncbi:alpha/beta fold hydrolase [Neptuniibacter sp.]|uniref:alpha/beta hydrolase n=1 Tax=Neptuniibacter sp. TaxID=1962643 RepID=UPI002627AE81|nr:alpha/beta fold hydrolase [Neptuniibacter sp.]MCP4597637.1 alpha/beta fold hydrolase [Neptuniibacter sp.]